MNDTTFSTFVGNRSAKGFIRITRIYSGNHMAETIECKPNMILYSGADIMAQALAGIQGSAISHFYVAYNDNGGGAFPGYAVAKGNNTMLAGDHYGYLKVPLTYPASYLTETNYSNNIVVFTILLSSPESYKQGASIDFSDGVQMFEVSLVAASASGDKIFSRAQFTPITYDSSHNITISWGIKFITD